MQECREQRVCAAAPARSFADAVIGELIKRFWYYEVIGKRERTLLSEALDGAVTARCQ